MYKKLKIVQTKEEKEEENMLIYYFFTGLFTN